MKFSPRITPSPFGGGKKYQTKFSPQTAKPKSSRLSGLRSGLASARQSLGALRIKDGLSAAGRFGSRIKDGLSAAGRSISGFGASIGAKIKDRFSAAKKRMSELPAKLKSGFDWARRSIGGIGGKIVGGARSAFDFARKGLSGFGEKLKGGFDTARKSLSGFGGKLSTGFGKLRDSVKSRLRTLSEGASASNTQSLVSCLSVSLKFFSS